MIPQVVPEIYVSYAWEPQSEKIVDTFAAACRSRGFKLVRDKTDIHFKGLITEFMKHLGQGKFVLVILSDKYLKSDNCMFELLEIAKNGDFYNRIFPIVTDTTNFYKPIGRIHYISYWENQIRELNEAMKGLESQADLKGIRESIDHYTRIRSTIGDLTDILKDMNSLTVQQHLTANFDDVFNLIETDLLPETKEDSLTAVKTETSETEVTEKKKQNRIIANLMSVSLPENLYIARLTIDRNEIIEKSWETDYKLKRKASDRKVTLAALHNTKKPFGREFQVSNKIIISFWDLANKQQAFSNIIDPSSVEQYSIPDFLATKPELEPTFIALLNNCLQQKLIQKEIEWVKDGGCYRFKVGALAKEKKVTWKGLKQATRTVIFEKFNKDKTLIVGFKHLAFEANFLRLQSGFYLAVNPTWSVTRDGKVESVFAADDIAGQKRLENNQAVSNHFRFLQYCLINSLSETDQYDMMQFSELADFETI